MSNKADPSNRPVMPTLIAGWGRAATGSQQRPYGQGFNRASDGKRGNLLGRPPCVERQDIIKDRATESSLAIPHPDSQSPLERPGSMGSFLDRLSDLPHPDVFATANNGFIRNRCYSPPRNFATVIEIFSKLHMIHTFFFQPKQGFIFSLFPQFAEYGQG